MTGHAPSDVGRAGDQTGRNRGCAPCGLYALVGLSAVRGRGACQGSTRSRSEVQGGPECDCDLVHGVGVEAADQRRDSVLAHRGHAVEPNHTFDRVCDGTVTKRSGDAPEASTVLATAKSSSMHAYVVLSLMTGIRTEEACRAPLGTRRGLGRGRCGIVR
jgi:hypothetical protein